MARRAATTKARAIAGPAAEPHDTAMLHRLLFFSDAVFAIVLTILVLELRPPEARTADELRAGLIAMAPHFTAFAMTFAVISIFWAAQMNTLRPLRHFDWPTAFVNLALLFPICLMPFVTGMMAQARFGAFAWALYSWVLIAASVGNVLLVLTVSRGNGRLTAGMTKAQRLYRAARAATPGLAFGAGLISLELGALQPAQFCWVLIPLLFGLAQVTLRPRA